MLAVDFLSIHHEERLLSVQTVKVTEGSHESFAVYIKKYTLIFGEGTPAGLVMYLSSLL